MRRGDDTADDVRERIPAVTQAATQATAFSGRTDASRPPDVCGSSRSCTGGIHDGKRSGSMRSNERWFAACNVLANPSSSKTSAPGQRRHARRIDLDAEPGGGRHLGRVTQQSEPGHIGARTNTRIAQHLHRRPVDCCMEPSASTHQSPRQRARMFAELRTPVPTGLVRINASSIAIRCWCHTSSSSTVPVTAKPTDSSGPSPLWPPVNSAPASSKASLAAVMTWNRSSSIRASAPCGTVTQAMAVRGRPPIAYTSFNACSAAIRPTTNGSSQQRAEAVDRFAPPWHLRRVAERRHPRVPLQCRHGRARD